MITQALAIAAYIYAYPLVIMQVTKDTMTRNKPALENRFFHIDRFPDDTFKDIVRPNVDTLYSTAWLDLTKQPIILSLPDTHDRYYVIELMDAWTNVFASPGKRTTGTKAQDMVIVGPNWTGKLPQGMQVIKSPTNMVFVIGRTQTNGKQDVDYVHAIQKGYALKPLNAFWSRKPLFINSAVSGSIAPVDQVKAMDATHFYTIFSKALKNNPAPAIDSKILEVIQKIGDTHTLDPQTLKTLNAAIPAAQQQLEKKDFPLQNGWLMFTHIGIYGTDYNTRAVVAHSGIGANLPEDALYPTAFVDGNDKPLTGQNKYVIHFDKNKLPPVNAFWSITIYGQDDFLIKNPINRFALGDRDNYTLNKDGSLDIYIQHASPGTDKENNWLPIPSGPFNLTMRLYWPKKEVLNGTWKLPPIRKVS